MYGISFRLPHEVAFGTKLIEQHGGEEEKDDRQAIYDELEDKSRLKKPRTS
jgi:hypothetical protein